MTRLALLQAEPAAFAAFDATNRDVDATPELT
jgi:hypothetical protein